MNGKLRGDLPYHITAALTAAVWGTTFISSKLLLDEGLSPAAIMTLRFALAYVCMLPFLRGRIFADNWRDELQMALLGITGGSLYFLLENTALLYTQASNVAIIIAATPLLTTLAVHRIVRQESAGRRLYICSLISLAGVALVVFNGQFLLKLNPRGDLLTFIRRRNNVGHIQHSGAEARKTLPANDDHTQDILLRRSDARALLPLPARTPNRRAADTPDGHRQHTLSGNRRLADMLLDMEHGDTPSGRHTRHKLPLP